MLSKNLLFFMSFVLSACSILYELVLAQSMSATLGNTFLRYNVTIGFYLASLGVGALLCARWTREDWIGRLIDVELALCWIGTLSPLLILLWDSLIYHGSHRLGVAFRGFFYQAAIHLFNHGLIILVGVLSGFELPLLMKAGASGGLDLANDVLAVDYFGTLAGALAFPLLFLPVFGVINTAVLTGLGNALCGLYLCLSRDSVSRGRLGGYLSAIVVALALLLRSDFLHGPFVDRVYYLF